MPEYIPIKIPLKDYKTKIFAADEKLLLKMCKSMGKEFLWADKKETDAWQKYGDAVTDENAAIILLPSKTNSNITLCLQPVLKRLKILSSSLAVLAIGDEKCYIDLLDTAIKMLGYNNMSVILLLPVKPNFNLSLIFNYGFCLRSISPLCDLRPFYIFELTNHNKIMYNIKEFICKNDTFTISKQLENGYIGVCEQENKILLLK